MASIPLPPPGKQAKLKLLGLDTVPTSKSKLFPTPLSLGLCGECFSLYFPPESCDQLHNPSTWPVLPPWLGPGLHQGEQSSSPPCPALSRVAPYCCVRTFCPSWSQLTADRPRKPSERLLHQAKLFFKFVSLRNNPGLWQSCCGLWTQSQVKPGLGRVKTSWQRRREEEEEREGGGGNATVHPR